MSTSRRQNISNPERGVRIVLGAGLVALGLVVVLGGPGPWGWVGAVIAVGAGVDFVVTGVSGYCPLYARLGPLPHARNGAAQ